MTKACHHCKSEVTQLVPVYVAMKLKKLCRHCFAEFLAGRIIVE